MGTIPWKGLVLDSVPSTAVAHSVGREKQKNSLWKHNIAVQRDPDRPERWDRVRFNETKRKVLHWVRAIPAISTGWGVSELRAALLRAGLGGILVDGKLDNTPLVSCSGEAAP